MNTTMNRQQHKTIQTDSSGMMLGFQLDNLILSRNLEPKTTSNRQSRLFPASHIGVRPPLRVGNLFY